MLELNQFNFGNKTAIKGDPLWKLLVCTLKIFLIISFK